MAASRLTSLNIQGYRPFGDFKASLGSLEVLVGANGSGKTALFEFLKFLRDGVYQDIPPEIIAGSIGQEIFHKPGPDRILWELEANLGLSDPLVYSGRINGPIGKTQIFFELVDALVPKNKRHPVFLDIQGRIGTIVRTENGLEDRQKIQLNRPTQLALSTMNNPAMLELYLLREYILSWRFYSSFRIANDKIRRPVPIEQEPLLNEDGGNLSAVLFYLLTEAPRAFAELETVLRITVPGFRGLSVKARGRGEVMAFWKEGGIDDELSLADVSDGILRLLCWTVLGVQPNPPGLICIDEPDQGLHPRALPILAGLFQKASERTQILLATHSSYFLTQFPLEHIAIMRKQNGESVFAKPDNSPLMHDLLEDFGTDGIEYLHRSDQLEQFS